MSSILHPDTIPSALSRSWLLVSGRNTTRFDEAAAGAADEVILDIEDAVDPSKKAAAREDVARWLATGRAWVRINDHSTSHWEDDVAVLRGASGLKGVVLAKVESAAAVTETARSLGGGVPGSRSSNPRSVSRKPPPSRVPTARSGWLSAAVTIDATPAPARTTSLWRTRARVWSSLAASEVCRDPSTARPWRPATGRYETRAPSESPLA